MAMTAKEKREARENKLREEGASAARAEMAAKPLGEDKKAELAELNQKQFANPGSAPSAAGPVAGPAKGRTVVVACKLGVAWFSMQLCEIVDKFEQNMQGGRTVKEASRVGPVVQIRGTAYPRGTPPEGFPPPPVIVGGAALNYGIDAEWFDAWVKQNEKNPIVMNKMVFAHESEDRVRGEARELAAFLSGLDPVNPKKDDRIPRSSRKGEVSDIEPEETRAKKAANA
jgi:hypothetical protein